MNKIAVVILGLALIVAIVWTFNDRNKSNVPLQPTPAPAITPQPMTFDFSNQGAKIDQTGQTSIENQVINPLGNRSAAVIVDNQGVSGTFYYLVGGMIIHGQQVYAQPRSLGDRIKVTSVTISDPGENDNGVITVEYLDRPKNVPLSTPPTLKVTKKYAYQDDGNLVEVLQ